MAKGKKILRIDFCRSGQNTSPSLPGEAGSDMNGVTVDDLIAAVKPLPESRRRRSPKDQLDKLDRLVASFGVRRQA